MDLINLIHDSALTRVRQFAQNEGISLEVVEEPGRIHGHWMCLILLAGSDLRLTIKIHYFSDKTRAFLPNASTSISEKHIADFIRELNNLIAGAVKRDLQKNSIHVGTSLPLLVRGFHQVFNMHDHSESIEIHHWRLRKLDGEFLMSAEIEKLREFELVANDSIDSSGDVEFF
jgi:hypothetical protein